MTFFAPASICGATSAFLRNAPVDSSTMPTPMSFQGSNAQFSVMLVIRISLPLTTSALSVQETSPGNFPWTESYLRRWARMEDFALELTATISMSSYPRAALTRYLPTRPKPFTAHLTPMCLPPVRTRASRGRRASGRLDFRLVCPAGPQGAGPASIGTFWKPYTLKQPWFRSQSFFAPIPAGRRRTPFSPLTGCRSKG